MTTPANLVLLQALRQPDPRPAIRALLEWRAQRVLQVPHGTWSVKVASGRDITDEGYDQVDIVMPGNCGAMLGGFDEIEDEVAVAEHLVAEANPRFVREEIDFWKALVVAHRPLVANHDAAFCAGCPGNVSWRKCPVLHSLARACIVYLGGDPDVEA